jgi:hypothetical protein
MVMAVMVMAVNGHSNWHGRNWHGRGHRHWWHGRWWAYGASGPWRLGLGLLLTALDPAKPNEKEAPAGAGWLSGPAPVQLVGEMRVGGMQDK